MGKESFTTEIDIFKVEFEFESKGKWNVNPELDTLDEKISITKCTIMDDEDGDSIVNFESLSEMVKHNILEMCIEIGREDAENN